MNTAVINLHVKAKPLASPTGKPEYPHPMKWANLEVILKVTERCNIDCTYCYFFNSENQDFKTHPPYIKAETIDACGRFLAQTARECGARSIQIDFHGGEPLMMKKHRFDHMCTTLRQWLKDVPEVNLVMQTNAMLIDEEWIEILARHNIGVGISIDGPREYHDINRVDHQGKGTYDATLRGLRMIQAANIPGWKNEVAILCVIDPATDAKKTFTHFLDELGVPAMHFLMPMGDHETHDVNGNAAITRYLCDLFDIWAERADPRVGIRYFTRLLGKLLGGPTVIEQADNFTRDHMAFTIASNGDIGVADDLRNTFPPLFWTNANVADTTFASFLNLPEIANHYIAREERHADCATCCFGKICDGGDLIGSEAFRFSNRDSFRNKSIYCDTIQALLTHMTQYAMKRGVSFDKIAESLIQ